MLSLGEIPIPFLEAQTMVIITCEQHCHSAFETCFGDIPQSQKKNCKDLLGSYNIWGKVFSIKNFLLHSKPIPQYTPEVVH